MSSPEKVLSALAKHDTRIYLAYNLSKDEYIYFNPAFERFFRLKPELAKPKLIIKMVHPEDRKYIRAQYARLNPGDFLEHLEFRLIIHGKVHFLRLGMTLSLNEAGDRIISAFLDDITSYKEGIDLMEALSNKKNAVLNILSHDLAGPLGSISNYSYLLTKKTDPTDQHTLKLINSIETISRRCIRLIQEFVKLEFIESTGLDLIKARHDLVKNISNFMEDYLEHEVQLKKTIRFVHDERQIFAEIDDYKFMQVINNLISNAIKFTPDEGLIELRLSRRAEFVRIEVKDTGIGIPESFRSFIFDKFSKARRTGLKGEASVGLGMSIIKTIVDWHDGNIWFESEVGVGTTFFIEIPGCL